jgi:exodeoxyribonuclease VII large subunit
MTVMLRGTPKLTKWGKFSFTIREVMPVGEGNLKKSFELLKAKLEKEGLFNPAKKRLMPENIKKIGVISSTGAAGYADFIKIINERWGGLKIDVAHVQVQGLGAAEQIVRALKYFNEHSEADIVAIKKI